MVGSSNLRHSIRVKKREQRAGLARKGKNIYLRN